MLYYSTVYTIMVIKDPQVIAPHFAKWKPSKVKLRSLD